MANIIGLTGQTGAGKSTVRHMFREKGASVIDADSVAHEITEKNNDCIFEIVSHFSCTVLNESGTINRKALGKRVFSDKKELAVLNKIMFPYILEEIERRIADEASAGAENIVIDGATVIESGCGKLCDMLISVTADEAIRTRRIIRRDNISREDAERRVAAQKPEEFYIENSDIVITNDESIESLSSRVNTVLKNMALIKEKISVED